MFDSKKVFTYIDSTTGITQDGEKYFAINVMTKGTHKKKLSFITKKDELINKISQLKFIEFQDVTLYVDFSRKFVKEKRYSYWDCELIDVGINRNN